MTQLSRNETIKSESRFLRGTIADGLQIQVSGSLCTGAAARVPGSIVGEVLRQTAKTRATINIGHPSGRFPVEAEAETVDGQLKIKRLRVFRTARRIMEGYVYVRKSVFK